MTPSTPVGYATSTTLWWAVWPGLAAMVFVGSSVAVIAGTQHLPVFTVQAVRYAIALLALLVLMRVFAVRLVLPAAADLGWVIGGALSGLVGFNIATIVGTRHAEPALLGAAVACIPIMLALTGPFVVGGRPSARVVIGAAVVGGGALAVTGYGRGDLIGVAMALAMIGCEAGLTLCAARALPRMGPWSYAVATSGVAVIAFAALAAISERPVLGDFAGWAPIAAIVHLGVLVTAVGFVLWFTGVQRLGPGSVGLCAGIAPPVAALIAVVLGAPMPTLGTWIGMATIAAGLALGFAPTHRRPPPGAAPDRAREAGVRGPHPKV